jgi:hypothetical protein
VDKKINVLSVFEDKEKCGQSTQHHSKSISSLHKEQENSILDELEDTKSVAVAAQKSSRIYGPCSKALRKKLLSITSSLDSIKNVDTEKLMKTTDVIKNMTIALNQLVESGL